MGLDTVELIYEIEAYFGIRIADAEAEQIHRVQEVADLVCRLLGCEATGSSGTQQRVLAIISQELQAALALPRPPAPDEPLARIQPPDETAWQPLLAQLAHRTGWQFPRLRNPALAPATTWLARLLAREPARWIDWRQGTLANLADWVVSLNYRRLYAGHIFRSPYDVLRAVVGLVSDKSGVEVWQIRPQDSITYDLGMD